MDSVYTIIVAILMVLAVSGLIVGVANDAVNFLNSALGSKAAPRRVIMLVASVGILIGAITSNGMMEVARSGVFYPAQFNFQEVMMLFLAVMFANVMLLDLFNTFGMPTSTTVSLVFGLLGAAIAVATVKISASDTLIISDLSTFINSSKAMAIISAILISVVVAFITGSIIMYFTRILFSFRYHRIFTYIGYFWCGIAFTAITYFAVFKGIKSANIIPAEVLAYISANMGKCVLMTFVSWSAIMALLQHLFKVNILKITILAGTFSLALAFAGNDLVNFIGVPIAGFDSYNMVAKGIANPDSMSVLEGAVKANQWFLIAAGVIMVITLWTSKKANAVTQTEINLAKQDEGMERFGSTIFSRSIVRLSIAAAKNISAVTPHKLQAAIEKRFTPYEVEQKDKAPFDLIRATLNLTVASILISLATSFKLPLSTTYVTFMVAMGSSLADRAWGRESAVYRITGVLTVISGWFLTAFIAFVIAYVIGLILMYGGIIAVVILTLLCIFMMVKSSISHRRKENDEAKKEEEDQKEESAESILESCTHEVIVTMKQITDIYQSTLIAVSNEDRKTLKAMFKQSNEIFLLARERKRKVLPTLLKLQDDYMDTGHYYVQIVDYLSEASKALVHITRPCFEHIDNNHEGMTKEQVEDLIKVNQAVYAIYERINTMLETKDFSELEGALTLKDKLFEQIADAIKSQLRRIRAKSSSTKASMLYLNILTETKTMILQSRNLLKAQKYFIK